MTIERIVNAKTSENDDEDCELDRSLSRNNDRDWFEWFDWFKRFDCLSFREQLNDVVDDLFETFFALSDDDLYALNFVLREQHSINVIFFVIEKSNLECSILQFLSSRDEFAYYD
jgi:hypothetical protein